MLYRSPGLNISTTVGLEIGQRVGKHVEIFSQTENIGNMCLQISFILCWQRHILILLSTAKDSLCIPYMSEA